MRILLDINHPADVHQFKNVIKELKKRNHKVLVTARNKECTEELLKYYGIRYIPRKGYKGIIGKTFGMLKIDLFLYKIAKKFNPDILVGSSGNCYIAHISKIIRKPSIIFDDTEHSTIQNWLTFPFASVICTPACYKIAIKKKQLKYDGYKELAYLSAKYFKPDKSILKEVGVKEREKFFIVRFVSWDANHDWGVEGIKNREVLVKELEKYGRVLISSEDKLRGSLNKKKISVVPAKIHHLLYYATMCISEGATTAVEAAVLGVPSVYINKLKTGYIEELEKKYKLLLSFDNPNEALMKIKSLLKNKHLKSEWGKKRNRMLIDKIDVTKWMINTIERG